MDQTFKYSPKSAKHTLRSLRENFKWIHAKFRKEKINAKPLNEIEKGHLTLVNSNFYYTIASPIKFNPDEKIIRPYC